MKTKLHVDGIVMSEMIQSINGIKCFRNVISMTLLSSEFFCNVCGWNCWNSLKIYLQIHRYPHAFWNTKKFLSLPETLNVPEKIWRVYVKSLTWWKKIKTFGHCDFGVTAWIDRFGQMEHTLSENRSNLQRKRVL